MSKPIHREAALAPGPTWRDYLELCKPRVVYLIVFTAIIGMLLTAVLAVLAAATLAYAGAQTGLWGVFLVIVNTLIGLAIMALVLAGLFRFAVGRRHPRPLYLPGAALGAVSTIAVFVGFGIYVNYATSYEAVYGALAGAIIFMLCVYFSAYAVLIGAALNADLSARRT